MKKGIPEYRDTNYTIINIINENAVHNYRQCMLSSDLEVKSLWIYERHLEFPDGFIEFKPEGAWDKIPWRVITIGPPLDDIAIKELGITVVPKDDCRNYKKWNK